MVLLLLAIACGTAPEPQPEAATDLRELRGQRSAEVAADQLLRLPPGEQMGAVFAYGEGVGRRLDLVEIVRRGETLPVSLRDAYLDGAAHGWAPPRGVPVARVVAEIEREVPERARRGFHRAAVMSQTIGWRGDPARVVPAAVAYGQASGELPLDGVRIGVQRALGHELPRALRVARAYPVAWRPALFEELGWRAGDTAAVWEAGLAPLVDALEPAHQCAFVHGAARGRALRAPWTDEADGATFAAEVTARAGACDAAAWRGVAWALALAWDHQPQRAHHYAGALPAGPREAVLGHLRALRGHQRGAPWEAIPARRGGA